MIDLYINGQRADLDGDSPLLFNYLRENIDNPTIVRNAYSHEVTLKGTPANNKIFGFFDRADRKTTATSFDASSRTPFALFLNGGEYGESGYCKLNSVKKVGGSVEYSVTLYGGLGDILYKLTTGEDGNPLSLADLDYDEDLTFTINRLSVKAGWDTLHGSGGIGTGGKWNIINFAPMLNGQPEGEFDADKVLVAPDGNALPSSSGGYTPKGGFVCVSLGCGKVGEWQVGDFRCYNQRAVIKVGEVVKAIGRMAEDNGYTLNLDTAFFNDDNPYYKDAWMTLPSFNALGLFQGDEVTQSSLLGGTMSPSSFLIGYCRQFGLCVVCDSARKMLNIYSRSTYFSRKEAVVYDATSRASFGINKAIVASTGAEVSNSFMYAYSNLKTTGFDTVRVLLPVIITAANPPQGLAFYDKDGRYISGVAAPTGSARGAKEYELTIPEGATSMKTTFWQPGYVATEWRCVFIKHSDDGVVDLTQRISMEEDITIVPYTYESRFYDLGIKGEGAFIKSYDDSHRTAYGVQRIDTGYAFGDDVIEMLDGDVFGAVADVQEEGVGMGDTYNASKTYSRVPYVCLTPGSSYNLYGGGDASKEMTPSVTEGDMYKSDRLVQMHDASQKGVDTYALLFLDGIKDYGTTHLGDDGLFISDDDETLFADLNNGKPCYHFNPSFGIVARYVPRFSRYKTSGGVMTYAWDFATPQMIAFTDLPYEEGVTIYPRYWEKYLTDRYDIDTRVMTCRVDLRGLPMRPEEMLMRFYYYGGAIWVMNSITDYNHAEPSIAVCEMVKVKDTDNYSDGVIY